MIDKLSLINFKAFRRLSVTLAPLTLLTGLNAAGKSSTMQALAMVKQSADAGLLTKDGSLLLNGELANLGFGQDVLNEYFTSDDNKLPHIEISLEAFGREFLWRAVYDAHLDREADTLKLRQGSQLPDARLVFGEDFQYLRADRVVPELYYPKSHTTVVNRKFLGVRGEHAVNYLRVFADTAIDGALQHPSARTAQLADNVDAWLSEICPGVNVDAVDIRGTDLVQLSYGFFGRAGLSSSRFRYRPTNVGFGLTYSLPIVVACLAAGSNSVVMLENPEAHLHPRGQSAMGRLAALASSSGAQVIIESHSDHVLNGVRLAVKDGVLPSIGVAIVYFHRELEAISKLPTISTTELRIGSNGMVSSWPHGFFDEWDNALDRLLD